MRACRCGMFITKHDHKISLRTITHDQANILLKRYPLDYIKLAHSQPLSLERVKDALTLSHKLLSQDNKGKDTFVQCECATSSSDDDGSIYYFKDSELDYPFIITKGQMPPKKKYYLWDEFQAFHDKRLWTNHL